MRLFAKIIIATFIVFWTGFIFLDYWQKHPIYFHSFRLFDYWGLAFFLALLGFGVIWSVLKFGKDKKRRGLFNGLSTTLLFLVVGISSIGFAYGKLVSNGEFSSQKVIHALGLTGGTGLAVLLIVLVSYVLGGMINERLKIQVKQEDAVATDLAAGIMGLVLFLFLLGAVSLLHWFILFPLFGILLFFGRKKAAYFFKTTFLQSLVNKDINIWGGIAFYLLVVLFSINFMAVNVPMPAGFDSLTLYANLPALIGQHHGLVEGFQPYNWSLLMSLGHVLFGSTEVSLALSYLGGALSAYAMYVLCRSWLKINVNYSLLAVLVFSLTPSVIIQSSAELKVDLGLLFIYLSIILLGLNYLLNIFDPVENKNKPAVESRLNPGEPELIWMGLLSGFSLGIKLTTLYFAFALICALWFARSGKRGFFAAFLTCMFLVFLLKIDEFAGLREYHIGVDKLKWGILLAAIFLTIGLWLENKKALLINLRSTALYLAFFVLPFLPWMVKNYMETQSFSPDKLMNGKQASPEINLEILERNLKK